MVLAAPRNRRPDFGKVIMIPLALGFLLVDASTLGRGSGPAVLRWLTTGLVCLFYLLTLWCYLRRSAARATSRSVTAHAAAIAAMMVPFVFPLLGSVPAGSARQWAGNGLVTAGEAWAVWSLRSLGRNVSVLAQARNLAEVGPYRWIRHPLYTGEIVSSLGLAVLAGTWTAPAVWAGFIALQAYRALREEQLLVRVLPAYRGYRERTAVLVPGLFLGSDGPMITTAAPPTGSGMPGGDGGYSGLGSGCDSWRGCSMPNRPAAYARDAADRQALLRAAAQLGWADPVVYIADARLDDQSLLAGEHDLAADRLEGALATGRHDALLMPLPGTLGDPFRLMRLLCACTHNGVAVKFTPTTTR